MKVEIQYKCKLTVSDDELLKEPISELAGSNDAEPTLYPGLIP